MTDAQQPPAAEQPADPPMPELPITDVVAGLAGVTGQVATKATAAEEASTKALAEAKRAIALAEAQAKSNGTGTIPGSHMEGGGLWFQHNGVTYVIANGTVKQQ